LTGRFAAAVKVHGLVVGAVIVLSGGERGGVGYGGFTAGLGGVCRYRGGVRCILFTLV
jgi:hypothetical protein